MSNLVLQWMADEMWAFGGIRVIENPGWKTHTVPKDYKFRPVGLINHHTAPPVPYPVDKLVNKCNITIDPWGFVYLVNAGVANDSGYGDPAVLNRVMRGEPVKPPTDMTASDRVTGNPWFIDIEVQHPGDGSPLPEAQRTALIRVNAVIMLHYSWNPMSNLIGHREWTRRKVDPRWDGMANPMPGIRSDTQLTMKEGEDMPLSDEDLKKIHDKVWFTIDSNGNSMKQYVIRTKANTDLLIKELAEADLDGLVDAIKELPDDVVDEIYHRLAPGPA